MLCSYQFNWQNKDGCGPAPPHSAGFWVSGQATSTAALLSPMNNVIPHDVHNVTPSYVGVIQRNENNDVSNVSLQSKSSLKYRNRNARKKAMKYTKKEVHKLMNRERYITNLSSKTLSSPQLDVLSLGLTFVPNQVASPTLMSESLDNFDRSNRLKYFFRNYSIHTLNHTHSEERVHGHLRQPPQK